MNKKIFSGFIILFMLFSLIIFKVSAETEYVWILKETIKYDKINEIENFNKINKDLYELSISSSNGSYNFKLKYSGEDTSVEDKFLKKGDSASSSVKFGSVPNVIKQGQTVELILELELTENNTYDKSNNFLETKANAFFDKPGAQPDIPSSDAVYFIEKTGEEKGTSVGTKTGAATTISTKLFANAEKGDSEGQQMIICFSAEGKIAVGTKYVYEWLPSESQNNEINVTSATRDAVINDIIGNISINESGSAYNAAINGMGYTKNNIIKSGTKSSCILIFNEKSTININENSVLSYLDNSKSDTKLGLETGKLWAYIKGSGGSNRLKIELKYADISIDGGIFAVEENEDYSVVWLFSQVASITSVKTEKIIELEPGQKIIYDKDGNFTIENFSISKNAENWGIPLSVIVNDSGFGWVNIFLYTLIGILILTFVIIFFAVHVKKLNRIKRISKFVPEKGTCVFCGKQIDNDSMFCPGCGAAVKKQKNDSDVDEKLL
ncbi:MAG: hypothetical protein A2Y15_07575 [Clostridiales bacterium GWF2_36_10]|nr:MAG: hypothetical protein A2Y15_07575 [Clostridiales bacterium GWF2_36_10]